MNELEIKKLFEQLKQHLDRQITRLDEKTLYARVKHQLNLPAYRRLLLRLSRPPQKIRLSDRKDLILLLLFAPGRTGQTAEPLLGMTRITKLLFLACQELGIDQLVRNPYRFVPYKLGPFAPQLYDDLDLLIHTGLIRAEELKPAAPPFIQAELETVRQLLILNSGIGKTERLDSAQLLISLTPKGKKFARLLFEKAQRKQKNLGPGLKIIKAQFGSLPLSSLLRYVYLRYPEYTTRSEILKKILPEK